MRHNLAISLLAVATLGVATPGPAPRPINVNEATEAELMTVPGVTAAVARRIVQRRPYRSIEQLIVDADLPLEAVRVARQRLALVDIHFPASTPSANAGSQGHSPNTLLPLRINVNAASEDLLVSVLGVDRNEARRLVAARPYTTLGRFLTVARLPPEKVRQLTGRLVLADLPEPPAPNPGSTPRVADMRYFPLTTPTAPPALPIAERLDANTATAEELIGRCGLSPMNAERIILARPYRSLRDLGDKLGMTRDQLLRLSPCLKASTPGGPG